MTNSIQFGDTEIRYRLKKSATRKTLSISVAGQQVEVTAPSSLNTEELQYFVRKKAGWILTKLDDNQQITPVYPRQMQSGESIHYLGRQYRLKVIHDAHTRSVKLWRGELLLQLEVNDTPTQHGEKLIRTWYHRHLMQKLEPLIAQYASQLSLATPVFNVRQLGNRWGSCSKNGTLNFHWQLARLPMSKIEFVCAHEVAHLREPNHSAKFRKLLAQLVPQHQAMLNQLSI